MRYKVVVQQCADPVVGAKMAAEISRWSGMKADAIQGILAQKPVCIRKQADDNEALHLKSAFEAMGGRVSMIALNQNLSATAINDDEEEPADTGHCIPDSEYTRILNSRKDIFVIEKEAALRNYVVAALIFGACFGYWLSIQKITPPDFTDFYEKTVKTGSTTFTKVDVKAMLDEEKKRREGLAKQKDQVPAEKKTLVHATKKYGDVGKSQGGGDPREHVTKLGVLGLISGKITGRHVANADIFGRGGFAENIGGILLGTNGLKPGGSSGSGRREAVGIGFGTGYGSGFGEGAALTDVNQMINNIFDNEGQTEVAFVHKPKATISVHEPELVHSGQIQPSGRSKVSIMRVVMQNINALRYAYNKRLGEKPGLKGKVTCRFAIDEFGRVIFCEVLESNLGDPMLEHEVVDKIKQWAFEKIDKPGDIAEVMYPFVFSQ